VQDVWLCIHTSSHVVGNCWPRCMQRQSAGTAADVGDSHSRTPGKPFKNKFKSLAEVLKPSPNEESEKPVSAEGSPEEDQPCEARPRQPSRPSTSCALALRESLQAVPKGCKTKEKRRRVLRDKKRLKKLKRQVQRLCCCLPLLFLHSLPC
jgi:hypothetical protein